MGNNKRYYYIDIVVSVGREQQTVRVQNSLYIGDSLPESKGLQMRQVACL